MVTFHTYSKKNAVHCTVCYLFLNQLCSSFIAAGSLLPQKPQWKTTQLSFSRAKTGKPWLSVYHHHQLSFLHGGELSLQTTFMKVQIFFSPKPSRTNLEMSQEPISQSTSVLNLRAGHTPGLSACAAVVTLFFSFSHAQLPQIPFSWGFRDFIYFFCSQLPVLLIVSA